jgi:hypothetical protein
MIRKVLPHLAGTPRLNAAVRAFGTPEAFAHVHGPVGAEAANRLAALRVDRLEIPIDRKQQPLVAAVLAPPVVDAAAGHAGQPVVDPDFLAGGGVERDQRIVPSGHVDHIVDDDGIEAGQRVGIEPGDLELANVGFLDLIEIDELGSGRAAAEVPPVLVAAAAWGLGTDAAADVEHAKNAKSAKKNPGPTHAR